MSLIKNIKNRTLDRFPNVILYKTYRWDISNIEVILLRKIKRASNAVIWVSIFESRSMSGYILQFSKSFTIYV